MYIRVSQKNIFLKFCFHSLITALVPNCLQRPQFFLLQNYRLINDTWRTIFSAQGDICTRGNFPKSIFGNKISFRNALSYIFIALFRDTSLAHICHIYGLVAILAIYGHMAIRPYATNMGKLYLGIKSTLEPIFYGWKCTKLQKPKILIKELVYYKGLVELRSRPQVGVLLLSRYVSEWDQKLTRTH